MEMIELYLFKVFQESLSIDGVASQLYSHKKRALNFIKRALEKSTIHARNAKRG